MSKELDMTINLTIKVPNVPYDCEPMKFAEEYLSKHLPIEYEIDSVKLTKGDDLYYLESVLDSNPLPESEIVDFIADSRE